ncbi:hypothetical protein T9A_03154 [Alcanivorax jadensis T9]|jgi:hypothetical protein|uniref:Uncharacterized protein n=1 Tax=Alcanivorax jadensis T9 TaxID=1177181 RepID=A0ABR4W8Z1_9GAMM|nr:hypothetical protein [Alcanivorax jadensis]KGD59876.1 hypothetical protein T9A_03154 [Alcanivorax jadensis T9]
MGVELTIYVGLHFLAGSVLGFMYLARYGCYMKIAWAGFIVGMLSIFLIIVSVSKLSEKWMIESSWEMISLGVLSLSSIVSISMAKIYVDTKKS